MVTQFSTTGYLSAAPSWTVPCSNQIQITQEVPLTDNPLHAAWKVNFFYKEACWRSNLFSSPNTPKSRRQAVRAERWRLYLHYLWSHCDCELLGQWSLVSPSLMFPLKSKSPGCLCTSVSLSYRHTHKYTSESTPPSPIVSISTFPSSTGMTQSPAASTSASPWIPKSQMICLLTSHSSF